MPRRAWSAAAAKRSMYISSRPRNCAASRLLASSSSLSCSKSSAASSHSVARLSGVAGERGGERDDGEPGGGHGARRTLAPRRDRALAPRHHVGELRAVERVDRERHGEQRVLVGRLPGQRRQRPDQSLVAVVVAPEQPVQADGAHGQPHTLGDRVGRDQVERGEQRRPGVRDLPRRGLGGGLLLHPLAPALRRLWQASARSRPRSSAPRRPARRRAPRRPRRAARRSRPRHRPGPTRPRDAPASPTPHRVTAGWPPRARARAAASRRRSCRRSRAARAGGGS